MVCQTPIELNFFRANTGARLDCADDKRDLSRFQRECGHPQVLSKAGANAGMANEVHSEGACVEGFRPWDAGRAEKSFAKQRMSKDRKKFVPICCAPPKPFVLRGVRVAIVKIRPRRVHHGKDERDRLLVSGPIQQSRCLSLSDKALEIVLAQTATEIP